MTEEDFEDLEFKKGVAGENTGGEIRRIIKSLLAKGATISQISVIISRSDSVTRAIENGAISNPPQELLEALRRSRNRTNFSELNLSFSENIKEVEIFAVGTWKGLKFVAEDLFEIAKNSNKLLARGRHKPPLKLGHDSKQVFDQTDGQPALGWLENFKVKGQKLVADFINVPDILIKAMKKQLFRQVSVELSHIEHTGFFVRAAS